MRKLYEKLAKQSLDRILLDACEKGDLEKVKLCIKLDPDVYLHSDVPISLAIGKGHLDVVKYLVKQGVKLQSKFLCKAAEYGRLEIVKYLVEQGANLHLWDEYALRWASYYGHLEIVKYLVEYGADIHARKDEALRAAALKGHFEVVKYLVEKGANVRSVGLGEHDVLCKAVEGGSLEIVKYLVEHGANRLKQALRYAERCMRLDIVDYLKEVMKIKKGNGGST